MSTVWNTGLAAERARHNLRLKNKRRPAAQAASSKRQEIIERYKKAIDEEDWYTIEKIQKEMKEISSKLQAASKKDLTPTKSLI